MYFNSASICWVSRDVNYEIIKEIFIEALLSGSWSRQFSCQNLSKEQGEKIHPFKEFGQHGGTDVMEVI